MLWNRSHEIRFREDDTTVQSLGWVVAAWRSHSLRQIEHLPQSAEMVGCTIPIRLLVTLHMIFTFWAMMVSVNGISNNMVCMAQGFRKAPSCSFVLRCMTKSYC